MVLDPETRDRIEAERRVDVLEHGKLTRYRTVAVGFKTEMGTIQLRALVLAAWNDTEVFGAVRELYNSGRIDLVAGKYLSKPEGL